MVVIELLKNQKKDKDHDDDEDIITKRQIHFRAIYVFLVLSNVELL